jgi:hypothetical protein
MSVKEAQKTNALNILDDLAKVIDIGFIEDTFEVKGVLWKMRILNDHERTWANGYVRTVSVNAMLTSIKPATLAIAIRQIGTPGGEMVDVEDFFLKSYKDEEKALSEAEKAVLSKSNPYVRQYYFAEQLYVWLSHRTPEFVQELWKCYDSMVERVSKAEEAMGKSSKPDGQSKTES